MKHRIISLLFFIISIQVVPGRPPSSIEEALQCVFFVSGYDRHNNHTQSGSAFLVEENGVQWIYTNAHVIDGAAKIEIRDSDQQLIRDFGKFGATQQKQAQLRPSRKEMARTVQRSGWVAMGYAWHLRRKDH